MPLRRPLVALLLVALAGVGLVFAFLRIVVPEPTYHAEPRLLRKGALTQHVFFVVVDGLRFDVATDPRRMPHFSQAMQKQASAEMWAARVSMTTSAVLAFGTGQPGGMDQVVRNVHPRPPAFDSWIKSAHEHGISTAVAGDPAWKQMYREYLDEALLDPPGAGIEEDFNPKTFADTRALLRKKPGFLVAHFVTPDHQGHTHGIQSEGYAAHIRDYDQQLHDLLSELGPEWTVVVTSDHGAVDSGTHGSDSPIQRRTPAYAYGPGIVPVRFSEPVDQLDLAVTLAVLLGVAPPVHSRGALLAEWLDVDPNERTRLACDAARRVVHYARFEVGAEVSADGCASIESARSSVRAADRIVSERTGITSLQATLTALVGAVLFALIALVLGGRKALSGLPAAAIVAALGVALVLYTERLPGSFPNVVRGALFTLLLLPVLPFVFRPNDGMRVLERFPNIAPAVLPGFLLATYTANTQPLAWIAVAVTFVIACRDKPLPLHWVRFVLVVLALLLLLRAGVKQSNVFPPWYLANVSLGRAVASALLVGWFLGEAMRPAQNRLHVSLGLAIALGSFLARDHVPPLFGRAAIVGCGIAAAVFVFRGPKLMAFAFGFASFAWVSRNHEMTTLVLTLVVAQGMGEAFAKRDGVGRPALVMLLATAGFGLVFVQRLGIQNELDFGGMDLQAGAFGDTRVSPAVIGVAIGYKYCLASLLALAALVTPLARALRDALVPALAIAFVARSAMLVLFLFLCGSSYWTGLRVMADVPFPFLATLAALALWIGLFSSQTAPSRSSSS